MTPLELLFEKAKLVSFALPRELASLYGGEIGFPSVHAYANFVASLDGVVAVPGAEESGQIVSGEDEADRFVMALLRACADAVVIGASTFRHSPGAFWHAADAYPALTAAFAELRASLGLPPEPQLVVVTASGKLDPTQPALENALIATTGARALELRSMLPESARVLAFESEELPLAGLFEQLRAEGRGRLLTEGGPTLFGELLRAGLIDELYLTSSPRIFGRGDDDGKKSLVYGVELAPDPLELASVRRHGSHLFLRYRRTTP